MGMGKIATRGAQTPRESSFIEQEPERRGCGLDCLGDNVVRFRNREERERYMDNLERQMEHQREQIERTLDEIEPSRRRTALEKFRNSLPSFPSRSSVWGAVRERQVATERSDSEARRN